MNKNDGMTDGKMQVHVWHRMHLSCFFRGLYTGSLPLLIIYSSDPFAVSWSESKRRDQRQGHWTTPVRKNLE